MSQVARCPAVRRGQFGRVDGGQQDFHLGCVRRFLRPDFRDGVGLAQGSREKAGQKSQWLCPSFLTANLILPLTVG